MACRAFPRERRRPLLLLAQGKQSVRRRPLGDYGSSACLRHERLAAHGHGPLCGRARSGRVLDQAGRILGYTAAHPEDGEIFLLFVDPAHAGRGIGRTLLGAAHDALRAAGCKQAYLFTHEQNERALAVYASAGYRPGGSIRESDFNGTPVRELRLVKDL